MALLREGLAHWSRKLFPWLWRLALLSLPWQTRWFHEAPLIAGYPWEEGRSSVYISWFILLLTIIVTLFLDEGMKLSKGEKRRRSRLGINGVLLVLVLFTLVVTPVSRATIQWWMEFGMLYAFFRVLAERVTWREGLLWFVIGLIPEALLGISQAFTQTVFGSKWLGMATQLPATRGVAVVEAMGTRWLRAYGGFPHPNIFGGWLAVALVLLQLRIKDVLLGKRMRIFYYVLLVLFSVTLALTYSRSAWMGLVIATIALIVVTWRSSVLRAIKQRSLLAVVLMIVSFALVFAWRPALIFTRAQPTTRLEQKSVNERLFGVQNVWRVVRVHPLVGAGMGESSWMIAQIDQRDGRSATIPILPHAVPLLALMELGLFGGLLLVLTIWTVISSSRRFWRGTTSTTRRNMLVLGCVLLPAFFLDHYLWSYWSGKALLGSVCFFAFCLQKDAEKI